MKNTISITAILTIALSPIMASATETCSLKRALDYEIGPAYSNTVSQNGISVTLMSDTNSSLFRVGNSEPFIMELAKDVETRADTNTLIINLRDNCAWEDGHPITAEQILRGIQNTYFEEEPSSNIGREYIKGGPEILLEGADISTLGVRAMSDFTLEIDTLTSPQLMMNLLTRYSFAPFPTHLAPKAQEQWAMGHYDRLSSGPYKVIEMDNNQIHLGKNPYFCTDLEPEIENVFVHHISNPDAQTGLYFNDTINLIERLDRRSLISVQSRVKNKSFHLTEANGDTLTYLIQSTPSELKTPDAIQEALFLSIDHKAFSKLGSHESRTPTMTAPIPNYTPLIDERYQTPYAQRLELARKTMINANYNAENHLKIKITALENWHIEQILSALEGMWKQIYVDLDVDIIDFSNFSWKILTDSNSDYLLIGAESEYRDPVDPLGALVEVGAFANKAALRDKISQSFRMHDNDERLKFLAEIEAELQHENTAAMLLHSRPPLLLDDGLDVKDHYFLSSANISSESCNSNEITSP